MPPSPVVVDVPTSVAPRPSASFAGAESAPKLMPGDRDRDLQLERLLREPRAEDDVGRAPLAVALERVAGDGCAEEEEVVEVREPPLRAEPADVVDALGGCALDLGDDGPVEEVRLAQVPGTLARSRTSVRAALSILNV